MEVSVSSAVKPEAVSYVFHAAKVIQVSVHSVFNMGVRNTLRVH